LTAETRNLVDSKFLARCKKCVRLINCARGGLVVEADLKAALIGGRSPGRFGRVRRGAARHNPLFGMDNVVCTPHLGASTMEAQENVAQHVRADRRLPSERAP